MKNAVEESLRPYKNKRFFFNFILYKANFSLLPMREVSHVGSLRTMSKIGTINKKINMKVKDKNISKKQNTMLVAFHLL